MNAVEKLKVLYEVKETTDAQIAAIEALLEATPTEIKVRRKRGPNKPKVLEVPNVL